MDESITAAPSMKSAAESTPTLLVLGAGPKGIAIAAKRHMLAKLGYPVPHLRIIDRQGVASHWSGRAGFTDGHQLLGTRPEKDVGWRSILYSCWRRPGNNGPGNTIDHPRTTAESSPH